MVLTFQHLAVAQHMLQSADMHGVELRGVRTDGKEDPECENHEDLRCLHSGFVQRFYHSEVLLQWAWRQARLLHFFNDRTTPSTQRRSSFQLVDCNLVLRAWRFSSFFQSHKVRHAAACPIFTGKAVGLWALAFCRSLLFPCANQAPLNPPAFWNSSPVSVPVVSALHLHLFARLPFPHSTTRARA